MERIAWDPSISVGVKVIDTQHKHLIKTIAKLNDSIKKDLGDSVLESTFVELEKYVDEHFALEEKYFDKFHYEFAAEHKQKHAEFRSKLEESKKKYASIREVVSLSLITFLIHWLIEHVKHEDQKYVECFKEHGLK